MDRNRMGRKVVRVLLALAMGLLPQVAVSCDDDELFIDWAGYDCVTCGYVWGPPVYYEEVVYDWWWW